jgi:hypothetical protein
MVRYKDYKAVTQSDRIMLDILSALDKLVANIVPEKNVEIPFIMQEEEVKIIKENVKTRRQNNKVKKGDK